MRGPRTELGKRRASRNSTKHGLYSQVVLLEGERKREYNELLIELQEYYQPVGPEEVLVDKLAATLWRQRRSISMEVAELKRSKEPGPIKFPDNGIENTKGLNIPLLDRLMRCDTAFDRTIDRILYQLERLQRMRRGQPVPPEQRVRLEL